MRHATLLPPLRTVRTIVSVHSFEGDGAREHRELHGYEGELSQFYLFTDPEHYPFHGCAAASGQLTELRGTGQLDRHPAVRANKLPRWDNAGMHMCVLSLDEPVDGSHCRWIGADRNCHQYKGTVAELLVYDRPLTAHEVATLRVGLWHKHFHRVMAPSASPEAGASSHLAEGMAALDLTSVEFGR